MALICKFSLFFIITLLFALSSSENVRKRQSSGGCYWLIGGWSPCTNNTQTRSISCVCEEKTTSNGCPNPIPLTTQPCNPPTPKIYPYPRPPLDNNNNPEDDDEDEPEIQCMWRWSRWSPCTQDCNGGNTSRVSRCFCDGIKTPVDDSKCNVLNRLEAMTVPCNQFPCGGTPACNKVCWIQRSDEPIYQNMTNGIFKCSLGCPESPSTCPKGQSYSDVLFNPVPEENPEWYYLAKEWYAAVLNKASGIEFPSLAVEAIKDASNLLEDCTGWGLQEVVQVYAVKEKLGRANNNIGGLDDVDEEVSQMTGMSVNPPTSPTPVSRYPTRTLWIISLGVPLSAVLIVSLTLGLAVYYSRRQPPLAVEQVSFEDEDDDQIPLQPEPVVTGSDKPMEG